MAFSKKELENFRHETQKTDSNVKRNISEKPKINKKILVISIVSVIVVLIAAGIGYSYINSKKPGPLDDFAQCLTDKGAVMYGASWCKYTDGQKAMFGNSIRFIDYRDYSEKPEVKITPTWFIDGQKYENAQSLDKLALVSGCSLS